MKKTLKRLHAQSMLNDMKALAKKAGVSLAAFGATVLATGAQAAIDVTAATTGISDAQTAVLAVLAVMITMAAAIFGVKKVLALLNRGA